QSTTVPKTSNVSALIEAGSMSSSSLCRACYDGRDGEGKPRAGVVMSAAAAQRPLRRTEATMIAIWVKVRIKPDMREKFLKAIEADALGSERDEPGCLRFNVLQDEKDANVRSEERRVGKGGEERYAG